MSDINLYYFGKGIHKCTDKVKTLRNSVKNVFTSEI